jgi:hypothetical protein
MFVQKKKLWSKSVKTVLSGLANRSIQFWQKISELQGSATKASRWHLTSTWTRMKVPRGNPRTKQVESNIKLATLVVTNVTLVRIVLKLKLLFIRLSMIIWLTCDPKLILTLQKWLAHLAIVIVAFGYQNTRWVIVNDSIRLRYQNFLDQIIGSLRCIESLTIKQKMIKSLLYHQAYEPLCKFDSMQSQVQDKCLSVYLNLLMALYLVLLQK